MLSLNAFLDLTPCMLFLWPFEIIISITFGRENGMVIWGEMKVLTVSMGRCQTLKTV